MLHLTLVLLIVCRMGKGVAQVPNCKTENTCDCCKSNPNDESRRLSDICNNQQGSSWSCKYGCKDGYWGNKCWNYCPGSCISCPQNYESNKVCNVCDDGYYGTICATHCPANCADNQCDKTTGTCLQGCASTNWAGKKCNVCADTWYGINCDSPCPRNCNNGECKENGDCTDGCSAERFTGMQCDQCITGRYGVDCNKTCPENCNDSMCTREDGNCLNGCKGNFAGERCTRCKTERYGTMCRNTCPDNCVNKLCDEKDGICLKCITGFYGKSCDLACSPNCKDNVCDQNTGKCALGCIDTEENGCDQPTLMEPNGQTSDTVTSDMLERHKIIMIGGMVGGFVFILVIIQVQWFILRRMSRQTNTEQRYITPDQSKPEEKNEEGVYANPDYYGDGNFGEL
ncbi:hypothetical protein ACF0H5_024043 [Mactra antiquata]